MSENLSILDGELRRQFAPVDRLSVDNQGGGVSPWVISDFLDISTLSVSENGLYLAAEDDCDAYEEVEVSAELEEGDYRKITGKDPNLDPNNDYAVGLDENGNLTKEMIPSAIHIVVPPRKLKYEDGETIDFSGIHVYLLDGNNHLFTNEQYPTGEIPFEELLLPITIANATDIVRYKTSDLDLSPVIQPVPASYGIGETGFKYYTETGEYDGGHCTRVTADALFCGIVFTDTSRQVFASSKKAAYHLEQFILKKDGGETKNYETTGTVSRTYTYQGKTVHYGMFGVEPPVPNPYAIPSAVELDIPRGSFSKYGQLAWTLIYGDDSPYGGGIPVQWMRSDGELLEDKFSITVSKTSDNNTSSGTSDSGSGHTSGGF